MTWTSDQHRLVARTLLGTWPGTITAWGRDAFEAYLYVLQARGLSADQVVHAIGTWPAGSDFPPSAPNLAAAAISDPSRPTFSEMCVLVFGPHGVLRARTSVTKSWWEPGERAKLDREAMAARADELHPLVAAFVREQTIRRLLSIDLEDSYRRHELQARWEEFCERHEQREVAAIASGDRRATLERLNPLAALNVRPAVELAAGEATSNDRRSSR